MRKALEGIKVIDLTTAYSGPIGTMQLADFGATVIKIENTKFGDGSRTWEPTFNGGSINFLNMNRNKKSITLNLKSDEGKKILFELVKNADVVTENFRPGTCEKLGIDYSVLKEINPKLVMASLSGFGQTGPYASRSAYSNIVEASSGVMYVTGHTDSKPTGSGIALGDSCAGMFMALGIMMALFHRERTGEGQYIDVSMTDSLVHLLSLHIISYSTTGIEPERIGNRDPSAFPYDIFDTTDGYCILGVSTVHDWTPFAKAVGLEHLIDDPRFDTNEKRVKNADDLYPFINEWSKQRSRSEIQKIFTEAKLAYAPVSKISEVIEDEQINARDMIVELEDEVIGKYKMQGIPLKLSKTPGTIVSSAPKLGEHTVEVLKELNLSDEQIKDLKEKGII